ncbi:MAG TPA: hypothetical protein VGM10_13630 [Actinocrinis sp.]|jgi:NitT/TauT family transport system substrate-binding protein
MSHPRRAARRPRPLTGISLGLAAVLAAGGVAACGNSGGLGSPDLSDVTVGMVAGSLGAVPFEFGDSTSQHAFSDAGLNITVQNFTSESDEDAALKSGKIDIAYGEYGEFLSGDGSTLAATGDIRVLDNSFNAGTDSIALVVRNGEAGPTVTGLDSPTAYCTNDYTIAVPGAYSDDYLALATWLDSQDAPAPEPNQLSTCPAIMSVGSEQAALTAVASNQASAAVLQEPFVTTGEVQQGLEVADDLTAGAATSMPLDGFFASSTFTAKYPRTSAIFASVMAQMQGKCAQRFVVEQALDTGATQTQEGIYATMELGEYPTSVMTSSLSTVVQLMSSAGLLGGQVNISTLTELGG